jgi:hypothetical protein
MQFDRAKPHVTDWRTFPRRRFSRDHQELNRYYWTTVLALDVTKSHALALPTHDASILLGPLGVTSTATGGGVNDRHHPISDRLAEAGRWLRLNTLLGSLSVFERYLTSVAEIAIQSNPTLATPWPKKVDGLKLQKHRVELSPPPARQVREGNWSKRLAAFTRLFGTPPQLYPQSISRLDAMSRIRNSVAHEFAGGQQGSTGSSANVLSDLQRFRKPGSNIKEATLIANLGLLDQLSDQIDSLLIKHHIGGFEIPSVYLDWNEGRDDYEAMAGAPVTGHSRSEEERFITFISKFSTTINHTYYRDMLAYLRTQ